jgi:hypothetical protein
MRPVEFGEQVPIGTQLTLLSDDKPDRLVTVLEPKSDQEEVASTLTKVLGPNIDIPVYRVADEEGKIHLLLNMPEDEDEDEHWLLWRPDNKAIDPNFIFVVALIDTD